MESKRKGMLLVISGASGTGKGTLCKKLLNTHPELQFSISATTRTPREGETDGVQYYFVSDAAFDDLIARDAFIEHANVHTARYGTLKSEVDAAIDRGESVLLDVDVQGGMNIMKKCPDCVSVFILPPSLRALRMRLEGRGTEPQEKIELRLRNAPGEIAMAGDYRYCLVNDELTRAVDELNAIYTAESLRASRGVPDVPLE